MQAKAGEIGRDIDNIDCYLQSNIKPPSALAKSWHDYIFIVMQRSDWRVPARRQGKQLGKWVLAPKLLECPYSMVTAFSLVIQRSRQKLQHLLWPWKSHTVTCSIFYWSYKSALIQCGRRLHRRWESLGPSWKIYHRWNPVNSNLSLLDSVLWGCRGNWEAA